MIRTSKMNCYLAVLLMLICSSAFAGKGLFITINNNTTESVAIMVLHSQCMQSDISKLNIPEIKAGASSNRIYVEDKGSGSCAFDTSLFTLDIRSESDDSAIINYTSSASIDKNKACGNQTGIYCIGTPSSEADISLTAGKDGSQYEFTINIHKLD